METWHVYRLGKATKSKGNGEVRGRETRSLKMHRSLAKGQLSSGTEAKG